MIYLDNVKTKCVGFDGFALRLNKVILDEDWENVYIQEQAILDWENAYLHSKLSQFAFYPQGP